MSEMSAAEAAIVARFEAGEPAPESWRGDGLREAIVDALWSGDDWTPDPTLPDSDFWRHYADRVLALPEVVALRAKAAAADRVRELLNGALMVPQAEVRRALDGPPC